MYVMADDRTTGDRGRAVEAALPAAADGGLLYASAGSRSPRSHPGSKGTCRSLVRVGFPFPFLPGSHPVQTRPAPGRRPAIGQFTV